MAQSAGYSKSPLNIDLIWEKASAEPPLEWTKGAAILEMTVFAKDGIEVRNLLRTKPSLVEPSESIYEVEITGEMEAQRKNRDVRNQEKRVGWENHVIKPERKEYFVIHFVGMKQMKITQLSFSIPGGRGATTGLTRETKFEFTDNYYERSHDNYRRNFRHN